MTQKFFLKIDAESPDGEAVKCETRVKVECSGQMAVAVLANVIQEDKNLKKLITEALLLAMEDGIDVQKITDDEYVKRGGDSGSDIEL